MMSSCQLMAFAKTRFVLETTCSVRSQRREFMSERTREHGKESILSLLSAACWEAHLDIAWPATNLHCEGITTPSGQRHLMSRLAAWSCCRQVP